MKKLTSFHKITSFFFKYNFTFSGMKLITAILQLYCISYPGTVYPCLRFVVFEALIAPRYEMYTVG